MPKVRVAAIDQVGEGRILRADANGRPLLLSRIEGRFAAIDAICTHAGGRLEDGDVENGCVGCPVQAAIFDLATGKVSPQTDWASDLRAYPVTVDGDELFVEIAESEPAAASDRPAPSNAPSAAAAYAHAAVAKGLDFNPMAPDQVE